MATHSSGKLIIAGLAGLAAGVAVGLLFAPQKGSKTRNRLKKKFRKLAEEVEENFSEELNELKSAFHKREEKEGQSGKINKNQ